MADEGRDPNPWESGEPFTVGGQPPNGVLDATAVVRVGHGPATVGG